MSEPAPTTKKFGKGERSVPHHSVKASKYYPAEDEKKPKKVSNGAFKIAFSV
jgi:large subunit ribosomal protein L6e